MKKIKQKLRFLPTADLFSHNEGNHMLQEHLTDDRSPWYLRKISSTSPLTPDQIGYKSAKLFECNKQIMTILQGIYSPFLENTVKFSL